MIVAQNLCRLGKNSCALFGSSLLPILECGVCLFNCRINVLWSSCWECLDYFTREWIGGGVCHGYLLRGGPCAVFKTPTSFGVHRCYVINERTSVLEHSTMTRRSHSSIDSQRWALRKERSPHRVWHVLSRYFLRQSKYVVAIPCCDCHAYDSGEVEDCSVEDVWHGEYPHVGVR